MKLEPEVDKRLKRKMRHPIERLTILAYNLVHAEERRFKQFQIDSIMQGLQEWSSVLREIGGEFYDIDTLMLDIFDNAGL